MSIESINCLCVYTYNLKFLLDCLECLSKQSFLVSWNSFSFLHEHTILIQATLVTMHLEPNISDEWGFTVHTKDQNNQPATQRWSLHCSFIYKVHSLPKFLIRSKVLASIQLALVVKVTEAICAPAIKPPANIAQWYDHNQDTILLQRITCPHAHLKHTITFLSHSSKIRQSLCIKVN